MNENGRPQKDPGAAGTVARGRLEDILRRAHVELSPSAADKARGRTALGLAEPSAATTPAMPTGWAALAASGKAGALASLILLGLGIGVGYGLGRIEPRAAAPIHAPAQSAVARAGRDGSAQVPFAQRDDALHTGPRGDAGGAVTAERAPAVVSGDVKAQRTPRRRSDAALAARPPSVRAPDERIETPREGEELAFMRRIERALRGEQPALALALLAEVETRFPRSALEEERLAASVMARCGLREPGHVQRARSFLLERSRSVYRTRVMAACGAAAVPTANDNRAAADDGKRLGGDQRRSKE